MRDFKIDGKTQRVFVLNETDTSIVYIPLKVLTRVDYERLLEIEKEAGSAGMLAAMRKKKLDNGRNALALYDSIIQVARKSNSSLVRVMKPEEVVSEEKRRANADQVAKLGESASSEYESASKTAEDASDEVTPKRRGRGRPPKNPQ